MSSRMFLLAVILIAFLTVRSSGDQKDDETTIRFPDSRGQVVYLPVDDPALDRFNRNLHFCVFENGHHDLIYVGTKYGMWAKGEFDLSLKGKVIFTGRVHQLTYEGEIVHMGDVIKSIDKSKNDLKITRITGWLK